MVSCVINRCTWVHVLLLLFLLLFVLLGRGVFALEHIESSTFVVEDRGILSQSKHVEDVEGNYLFDFTWNGTRYW